MSDRAAIARIHVAVPGPPAAGYDVVVGAGSLDDLPGQVAGAGSPDHWVVITDTTVARLYGERVRLAFESAGARLDVVACEPGESSKSRATWALLCDRLLELGVDRGAGVLALGGGVIGDLGGFVAATVLRGLTLVQVPTTLLAMVDASVGGKTAIDVPAGKNLVGVFKWPAAVVADPDVLGTLPADVYRAGLAECVKHAAIADAGHLAWLAANVDALLRREPATVGILIRRSIEIKADVVAGDPLETGRRAILNFGHTIAHAIERASGYAVSHGFAVAIGMVLEARLGERLGVTEPDTADRLEQVLGGFGLPVAIPPALEPAALLGFARHDKKNRDSRFRCALPARLGEMACAGPDDWTIEVPEDRMRAAFSGH